VKHIKNVTGCQEKFPPALEPSPLCFERGGEGSPARGDSLLHLYSNISIEKAHERHLKTGILALCGILTPYHKRQAHTLYSNVEKLISMAPSIGHVGFFSLTTKDNLTDPKAFSRRWDSFNSNFFSQSPHFGHWIGCFEQQKRGAWHLHLLVILPYDIREGISFEDLERRKYTSASPYLRSVWRDLRGACLRYGFGRHELLPVKSNGQAMARYVGKYISKHVGQRDETSKGKRLVTSSQGWQKNSIRFQFLTENTAEWRRKVKTFAAVHGVASYDGLRLKFGSNWAYKCLDSIYGVDETVQEMEREVNVLHGGSLINAKTGEIIF
jgi:hypothetical protein